MNAVFADTYYFIAQLNPTDDGHARAVAFTKGFSGSLWTTDWVLANRVMPFCAVPRARFTYFYRRLPGLPDLEIVRRIGSCWNSDLVCTKIALTRNGL